MTKLVVVCASVALVATGLGGAVAPQALAEDSKIVLDGSTTVGPIAEVFAQYYMELHKDVNVTVSASGSGNGAKSLINGACDIANMSRFMKDKEWKAAFDQGVKPVAHVVAYDGIAIIVHPANPVSELTTAQVRDIYLGKTTNWKEVGGPDKKIVKVRRDANSGTHDTFVKFVMEKQKLAGGCETQGSNGAVRTAVQTTPAAIGYVGLGFVDRTVKALTIDGVEASPATVKSGRYPIGRPLFMFTNGYPKLGSHIHAFVTLHLTPDGQKLVKAKGFVPVTAY
ncbi:MAG: phosphate ABC transporter substrate-binding protein [Candidatus Brocadiia bacterium]